MRRMGYIGITGLARPVILPEGEVFAQRLADGHARVGKDVMRTGAVADTAHTGAEFLEVLEVTFADRRRGSLQGAGIFQSDEFHRAGERELDFILVEDVENDHFALLETQALHIPLESRLVVKYVADHD